MFFPCFYDFTNAFAPVSFVYYLKSSPMLELKACAGGSWYKNLNTQAILGNHPSKPFPLEFGIRQDSVLSLVNIHDSDVIIS